MKPHWEQKPHMTSVSFAKKRNCCVLIIFVLFCGTAFSLDTEDYTYSGLAVDYNYYGVPFYIDVGYQYRDNYSNLFFPLVGMSIEAGKHSFNIFANAKIGYRYERFYTQFGFKQGLIPYIGDSYKYEYLESYGQFMIGYFLRNIDFSYNVDAGNMYIQDFTTKKLTSGFQLNHSVELSSLLHSDAANTLSLEASMNINTIPSSKQYSYEFFAKMPYSLYHYWGEFGIMPSFGYFQYFENSKKRFAIGTDYLGSIGMRAIAGALESHETLYNFISSIHVEYKLYLRFLPDAFRSIYLAAYANIGYGKELDQNFDEGRLLYATGGGIGYAMFGIAPLQVTFGIDQSQNIVINFAISTILHSF